MALMRWTSRPFGDANQFAAGHLKVDAPQHWFLLPAVRSCISGGKLAVSGAGVSPIAQS